MLGHSQNTSATFNYNQGKIGQFTSQIEVQIPQGLWSKMDLQMLYKLPKFQNRDMVLLKDFNGLQNTSSISF